MIDPKLKTEIRRLYFAEDWKVGTIATELGIHHDTVRRAIILDRFVRRGVVRPSQLDPYKAFIQQTLEQHPRLRATRLHEMVKARGYPGTIGQVRRYVRQVRPAARKEAFLALETLPGEQGQVDWGSFGRIQSGHASRSLSCFVMVLSWSHYSIPATLVRKPLVLVASETVVRVSTPEGEIVARHARSYDRRQRIENPAHLAALAAEKKRARELRGRAKLTDACPRAGEVLARVARGPGQARRVARRRRS
ncbi:MAG: hypothetical protein AAGA56_06750 [Myxococcota bacterium]